MTAMFEIGGVRGIVDPTNSFEGVEPERLMEICGLIPHFVAEVKGWDVYGAQDMMDAMMQVYGFPHDIDMGGEVGEDYMYRYPEDEPLAPLCMLLAVNGADILVYEYGIVAVQDMYNTVIRRMD